MNAQNADISSERWAYFVTAVTNHRARVLNRPEVVEIISQNVDFYREKYDFRFCGYVLMPDHWHFIMIAQHGLVTSILRDLKA